MDLRKRIKELEEALKFYASEDTWRNEECDKLNAEGGFFPYGFDECPIADDRGRLARDVLNKKEPESSNPPEDEL